MGPGLTWELGLYGKPTLDCLKDLFIHVLSKIEKLTVNSKGSELLEVLGTQPTTRQQGSRPVGDLMKRRITVASSFFIYDS